MPELPEVETIRRGLTGLIVGKTIVKVEVLSEKSWLGDVKAVEGRTVEGVGRRGKALMIELSCSINLMIHLRMTGQVIYMGEGRFAGGHPSEDFVGKMPSKHTRVILTLRDASFKKESSLPLQEKEKDFRSEVNSGSKMDYEYLYFNDQRKFGFVKVLKDGESDSFLEKLAPEPWDMSANEFYERLQRRRNTSIKAAILDQSVIAGVGNIYADEGLWVAKIAPERRAGKVSKAEAGKLLMGIRKVMERAIESGGSSLQNYVKADGTRGDYLQKFAKVFRREGRNCEGCGGVVEKIKVAGRGTHFCRNCQK